MKTFEMDMKNGKKWEFCCWSALPNLDVCEYQVKGKWLVVTENDGQYRYNMEACVDRATGECTPEEIAEELKRCGFVPQVTVTFDKVTSELTLIKVDGVHVGDIRRVVTAHGVRKQLFYKNRYVGQHSTQANTRYWIQDAVSKEVK